MAKKEKQLELVIPEKLYLSKNDLKKIFDYIEVQGMSHEDAQKYLNDINDQNEPILVQANNLGYVGTQRYREGQKFTVKKKFLSKRWMKVLPSRKETEQELIEEQPQRSRSERNQNVI